MTLEEQQPAMPEAAIPTPQPNPAAEATQLEAISLPDLGLDTFNASHDSASAAVSVFEQWQERERQAAVQEYQQGISNAISDIQACVLNGKTDEATARVASRPDLAVYTADETLMKSGAQDIMLGNKLIKACRSTPYDVAKDLIDNITDSDKAKAYKVELDSTGDYWDAVGLVGKIMREDITSAHEAEEETRAAIQEAQKYFEEAYKNGTPENKEFMRELGGYYNGKSFSIETLDKINKIPGFMESLNKPEAKTAAAALEYLIKLGWKKNNLTPEKYAHLLEEERQRLNGKQKSQLERNISDSMFPTARLEKEIKKNPELKKDIEDERTQQGIFSRLFDPNAPVRDAAKQLPQQTEAESLTYTDEEVAQQARANLSTSYEVTRQEVDTLLRILNKDGKASPKEFENAKNILKLMLNDRASDEQSLESEFLRNFGTGLARFINESADFNARITSGQYVTPFVGTPGIRTVVANPTYSEANRQLYLNKDIEALRSLLSNTEDTRLDVSEEASTLAQLLGDTGSIAGQSVLPTAAAIATSALTGGASLAGWAASAALTYPSAANAAIAQGAADGVSNPFIFGLATGAPEAAFEGIFDTVPTGGIGGKAVGKLFSKAYIKTMGTRGAGSFLSKLQSSTATRYLAGSLLEGTGEMMEDVGSGIVNKYAVYPALRAAGVDTGSSEVQLFANFADARECAAIYFYSLLLRGTGIHADRQRALAFAQSENNLLAVGHSVAKARELAAETRETAKAIRAIDTNNDLTAAEKETRIDELNTALYYKLNTEFVNDVATASPEELRKRGNADKQNAQKRNELLVATISGARDTALRRLGITADTTSADGTHTVYMDVQETTKDGTTVNTIKPVTLTEAQLNNWLMASHNQGIIDSINEYQGKLTATDIAANAEKDLADLDIKLLDLGANATPAFQEAFAAAQQSRSMTLALFRKMAAFTNEQVEVFVNESVGENATEAERAAARAEAMQKESTLISGVSNQEVINTPLALENRVRDSLGTTESNAAGVTKVSDNQRFAAVRFNGMNGGSVIAYFNGEISAAQFSEDFWEAKLNRAVNNGQTTWGKLRDQIVAAEKDMQRIDPSISLFGKGVDRATATPQQIAEAYSSLQAADFLAHYQQMPLSASTKALLGAAVANSRVMRAARLTAQVWSQVRDKADAGLTTYLTESGMRIADYVQPAEQQARERLKALEDRDFVPDPTPEVDAAVTAAEAEQQAQAENPAEPVGTPQPIPAEESVTGEAIPADAPLSVAPYNPQTGELAGNANRFAGMPKWQIDPANPPTDPAFHNGVFTRDNFGNPTGAIATESLQVADIPQLKTTAKIKGEWNPLSAPLYGVRMQDGSVRIISGRARLAHAKATNTPFVLVSIVGEEGSDAAADTRRWLFKDAYNNAINGTASASQIALLYREGKNSGYTNAQLESKGLFMRNKKGEPTAAMKVGITVAEHATDAEMEAVSSGKEKAETVAKNITKRIEEKQARAQETPQQKLDRGIKKRARWKVANKNLSADEQRSVVVKAASSTMDNSGTRYILNNILHEVKGKVESFVTTDGRRLTIFSRATEAKETRELLTKDGAPSEAEGNYPHYRQVIPDDSRSDRATVQFNLMDIPSAPNGTSKQRYTYTLDFGDGQVMVNSDYFNDVIKQVKALGQNMGASPVVTIGYSKVNSGERMQPITITAQAGEWTYKHVLMPVQGEAPTVRVPMVQESLPTTAALMDDEGNPVITSESEEAARVQSAFHIVETAEPYEAPSDFAYLPDEKEARKKARDEYRKLQELTKDSPIEMQDGKKVVFTGSGFNEIKNHSADRRVLACIPHMKPLCEEAEYMYSAPNSQPEKQGKTDIKQYHYYLAKAHFSEYNAYAESIGINAGESGNAYILIAIAERNNGEFFYDLDATSIEEVDKNTGTSENLQLARVPNAGLQADVPKGRVHHVKRFVNHMDALSAQKEGITLDTTASLADDGIADGDLMGDAIRSALSPLAVRLMHHAQREANRFRKVLKGKDPVKEAAEVLAGIPILYEAVRKYIPDIKLPRMTAERAALQAYATMVQQGRIGINRNGKTRRAGLTEEQITAAADMAEAIYMQQQTDENGMREANPTTQKERKQRMREAVREVARIGMGQATERIAIGVQNAIETHLVNKLAADMTARVSALSPVVSKSKKPLRAKVAPDAYTDLITIGEYLNLDATQYAEKESALINEHDKLEQELMNGAEDKDGKKAARLDEQERDIHLLHTYGNMRGRSLQEVAAAAADLKSYIATERHLWNDRLEAEKAVIDEEAQAFYEATEDKALQATSIALERAKQKEKSVASFAKQLMSVTQLLDSFTGSPALKAISERTLAAIANANVAIRNAEHDRENAMLSAFAELLGEEPQGENELYTQEQLDYIANHQFNDFVQSLLKERATGITRTFIEKETGKERTEEIIMSYGQLMNLILQSEQEHYQSNALAWGYTPEVISQIKDNLLNNREEGEPAVNRMDFAYALRDILQSDNLPAIYRDRTGIIMQENSHYWPGHLSITRLAQKENAAISDNFSQSGRYGMLKNRVDNSYDFAPSEIMSVFRSACAMRNNYIYMEPITAEWRRLLSRPLFGARMQAVIGATNYRMFRGFLDALDGAGTSEGFMNFAVNNAMSKALGSYARAVLAWSPTTIMRQVDAVMHAGMMKGINPMGVVAHIISDRAGKGRMTYDKIAQLPAFKARHVGTPAYADMIRDGADASWSRLGNWMRRGMNIIERVDIACNIVSACALYNMTYERLQRENEGSTNPMSEKEMDAICVQAVTNMLELTAQPLRRTQKSAFVVLNNSVLYDAQAFLGSEVLNKIGFAVAQYQKAYLATGSHQKALAAFMKPIATMGIASALVGFIIDLLRGATPDSDSDKLDWLTYISIGLLRGAAGADFMESLPLVGGIFRDQNFSSTGNLIPLYGAGVQANKIYKKATSSRDYSASEYFNDVIQLSREAYVTAAYFAPAFGERGTIAAELLGSITAALNITAPEVKGMSKRAIWTPLLPDSWQGTIVKKEASIRSKRAKARKKAKDPDLAHLLFAD